MTKLHNDCNCYLKKTWKHESDQVHENMDRIMTEALDEVKNELLSLSGKLYDEERILCQDLNGIVDPDEIDRHLDPISMDVDSTIKSYYLTLRTMHINFEDLSMRSLRQMAQNAKLFETLVQARDNIYFLYK